MCPFWFISTAGIKHLQFSCMQGRIKRQFAQDEWRSKLKWKCCLTFYDDYNSWNLPKKASFLRSSLAGFWLWCECGSIVWWGMWIPNWFCSGCFGLSISTYLEWGMREESTRQSMNRMSVWGMICFSVTYIAYLNTNALQKVCLNFIEIDSWHQNTHSIMQRNYREIPLWIGYLWITLEQFNIH